MNVQFSWPASMDETLRKGIIALYNDAIEQTTVIGYTSRLSEEEGEAIIGDLDASLSKGEVSLFTGMADGEMVVMALLHASKMPNCRHVANLSKGIIRSDHQRSGLARQAFAAIAEFCEAQGHELVTLDVRENSKAHHVWNSMGFREYGRLADYARVDGISHAGVFMCQPTKDLKARMVHGGDDAARSFMPKEEFREKLRTELEARITMTHPVVKKILNGTPNWELLRYMTLQGYQLTKHFLEYIETLYHHCPPGIHKKRLLMNMYEEETGRFSKTDNHVVLMQNFIKAIGINDDQRDSALPLPSTKALIDYRMNLVRNRATFHMGAAAVMIASEGQNLETAAGEARHDLLPRIYNLTPENLQFFSVHQKEDVGHVAEGISLVADICDTSRMQEQALDAVRKTCDLFYGMYEGVAEVFA
ncbi:MAG: GNAT family N-acetyltransferase [Dyella sp.]|uniref:GNAT family N-acetyltransferase n=1 Tax=Dyella sp. TaxID=1869338 RepID=UPI003F7EFA6D